MKLWSLLIVFLLLISNASAQQYLVKSSQEISGEEIVENIYLLDYIPENAELIAENIMMELTETYDERQWYYHSYGQLIINSIVSGPIYAVPDVDTDALEAHGITKGNAVIAIIDTGANPSHPDANLWTNPNEILDGIDNDNNGFIDDINGWDFVNNNPDITDNYGHGTAMTGIISAKDDNQGIIGMCPGCKVMVLKVTNDKNVPPDKVIQALRYAEAKGADVISMSFATDYDNPVFRDEILNTEVIMVAGAGNNGNQIVHYPAGYEGVISVAASDYNDQRSIWGSQSSNYGTWIDVTAPGTGIYTTNYLGGYYFSSGTSAATPIVAAIAGLAKTQFPEASNEEIMQKVISSGEPMIAPEYASGLMGSGRVNAYNAVTSSVSDKVLPICDHNNDGVRDLVDYSIFGYCVYTFDVNNDGMHDLVDLAAYGMNNQDDAWCRTNFVCDIFAAQETIVKPKTKLKVAIK